VQYPVSRVIVQRLCDDREDLVPYLNRIIDSLERHGGLYEAKLAEVVPVDVIDELNDWLKAHCRSTNADQMADPSRGLEAGLELLERIFPEYVNELVR
jgi:hypothetical protein